MYKATRPTSLKLHIESVHDGVKYGCELCALQFTFKISLKSHIKTVHSDKHF